MFNISCKTVLIATLAVMLFGCGGEADEAKKLGFASVDQMKEAHAKGWHTQQQYFKDNPNLSSGFVPSANSSTQVAANSRKPVDGKSTAKEAFLRKGGYWVTSEGTQGKSCSDIVQTGTRSFTFMSYREKDFELILKVGRQSTDWINSRENGGAAKIGIDEIDSIKYTNNILNSKFEENNIDYLYIGGDDYDVLMNRLKYDPEKDQITMYDIVCDKCGAKLAGSLQNRKKMILGNKGYQTSTWCHGNP